MSLSVKCITLLWPYSLQSPSCELLPISNFASCGNAFPISACMQHHNIEAWRSGDLIQCHKVHPF